MKVLKNKTIYAGNGKTECGYIRYDTIIAETGPMSEFIPQEDDEEVLTEACTVIPGFIDVHSHGGYGFDSMNASPEEIDTMVRRMTAEEGITSYFCTTMTQSYEQIETAMKNIRAAAEQNPVIQGIHVEGPFVSANYKGAQNEEYIRKPDARALARWNDLSGGRIRIVTYAPEEASPDFEHWCLASGILPSAGHSCATYDLLRRSKARHVTHLYNAQRGLNHREPGVTGYGLLTDGVMAELICDGIHIRPEMIRLAHRVKGSSGIELITDSMRAKGMPDGKSELGGQTVYVKDGTARLEDGTIAGSVLRYIQAFRNIMQFAGVGIEDAVQMSSVNQAREFGLTQKGAIAAGRDADFVLLDDACTLKGTVSMGTLFLPSSGISPAAGK
ncbi:MAG TPA: N-acetylglucosamine-6-phosphate deacetylase [Candidatus Fusicatenibacter intestinigallinarum]|uniref:N-acetylglucosamine-6-phosphate deacetylase n=1 Tax=Candidatus Fusicatenibacter intestinigallinarum TaxID=2838598 RepID=A0A9D2NB55_9FIRM|nr:N-acetylglucosamine-6-phosphate deacetylase [Candidatus Fusicatenibacter intestinigallinarum]